MQHSGYDGAGENGNGAVKKKHRLMMPMRAWLGP